MRKSSIFFSFIMACSMASVALICHALLDQEKSRGVTTANAELVQMLMLTDLCLFTEARYTRNPSLADIHSPFQDHPLALDHFPSGSIVTPPNFRREAP